MRILAVVAVLVLVALPIIGCGGGGYGGCYGPCTPCSVSGECCGSALCSNQTTDGFPRCIEFDFQCKLGS
jgi:hypothetical protein